VSADSPYTSRKRERHSYIHFYPDNWLAGVAGLPRIVWSVYFEICLYNWSKAKPMPEGLLKLTLSDMDPEQAQAIVQMLVDSEKVEQDETGAFYSLRAMEEAERAFRVWNAKVQGGRKNKKVSDSTEKGHIKESSRIEKKFQNSAGEIEDTEKYPETHIQGEIEDTSKSVPKTEESSKIPQGVLDRTKNQEPTYKEEANASSKNKDQGGSEDEFELVAKLRAMEADSNRRREVIAQGVVIVAEHWNKLALRNGWSQISRMTDRRKELLSARVAEHTAGKLLDALNTIPQSDYLMGRTDHKVSSPAFDWVFGEETCAKLVEGFYSRSPAAAQSPDQDDGEKEIAKLRAENFSKLQAGAITQSEFEAERERINAQAESMKAPQ
jgi:hypothetical protein